MTTSQIASWYGLLYGNSKYIHDFELLSDAKTQFALEFSNFISMKQLNIDSYYNTLFNKINNFIDKLEFTKEGKTTLEKHKGRKESTNVDYTDKYNEETKKATNTNLSEKQGTDYTDTTTFGKTEQQTGSYTDTNARNYFGNSSLADRSRDTHAQSSGANNQLTEGGTQSVRRQGTANNNEKTTIGDKTNNYIETTRNKENNYHQKIADALSNYTTIEDISASIFDNDVMDYNNYKETTKNSWHELQGAFQFLGQLSTKTFIEEILKEFFNYISYNVE